MEGNAFALARWFQGGRYANRPEDDFLREEILNEVYQADAVGRAPDGSMLVRTPNGACMIEHRKVGEDLARTFDEDLIFFDYVSNARWERTSFWMNESSVNALLGKLDELPEVEFDALFVRAEEET